MKWVDRLEEFSHNITNGTTLTPPPARALPFGLEERNPASKPNERSRIAMRKYAAWRNPRRWARIQKDYAWLEKVMQEIDMNPEEARFLL